jgi:hypothetical protein
VSTIRSWKHFIAAPPPPRPEQPEPDPATVRRLTAENIVDQAARSLARARAIAGPDDDARRAILAVEKVVARLQRRLVQP